ncbi:Protein CBG17597 [Caenorhabditis briggsae]|uniref:Protein CBG17597 n=1 Tax=Caenorhabditis briggsae TaxID=6238 RepID=B0K0A0_CAEBR|nr:Protein CBG17597 [Caenorhabditis briggsae]CAP35210.4 Protein CBG17597 [Caenorhabditis briggsae]
MRYVNYHLLLIYDTDETYFVGQRKKEKEDTRRLDEYAHFNRQTRQCSVYSDAINPNGYLEYKPNQNVIYIEKICIPDTVLPMSCDDVFRRIPQHILLGHASEVISVASENECVLECIKAKTMRSVACHSVLHYPDFASLNCILNVHTRHTKNQYFTPELAYKVDYVELGSCVTSSALDSQHGIGSVTSEWSEWTHCDEQTSTTSRQRFMPCFSANNFDVALQKFIKEQQEKEAIGNEVVKSREIEAEKKLLQQLDANPTVLEFPQKAMNENNKNSVEFFGPPQPPQQVHRQAPPQAIPRISQTLYTF